MNIAHTALRPTCEYLPTIIETKPLISRLVIQLAFFRDELKRSWPDFKQNPVACTKAIGSDLLQQIRASPNAIPVMLTTVAAVTCGVIMLLVVARGTRTNDYATAEVEPEIVLVEPEIVRTPTDPGKDSIGRDGAGRVGFNKGTGEGSGPSRQRAQGGGSGGDHNPLPPQSGKLPPPSNIQAAIPTTTPIHAPALPMAGMNIDPALWKDLKAPVFGDPRSASNVESKGPGEGEGIGTNKGTGIGDGLGPGYGPGRDGNMGNGPNQPGCCGGGRGRGGEPDGTPYRAAEVEQKVRLLSKPEPQYTEEARKNQLSGTVVLRVVFSSSGEVIQIRALHTLPFGLTERAIAAARQIQFLPAMKGGRAVSVSMQLEYNFNLY